MGRKGLDVLKDIADQVGWKQPTTIENPEILDKDQRKLIRAFNRVLRAMSGINDWRFLRKEGEITLLATYERGTMRMTNGSTSVSGQVDEDGNSPTWTSSHIGRAVVISGHPVVYRVSAVTSATAITLDRAFMGDTSDGGTTVDDYIYQLVQDRYDLPVDFDRPVDDDWTRYDDTATSRIKIISADDMREARLHKLAYSTGDPDTVALWMDDTQGEHRIAIFNPYPDDAKIVRFEYQRVHPDMETDNQRILFERRNEELVIAGVEWLLLRGPEDDQRATGLLQEFLTQQMNAVAQTEIGQQRTRITPSEARAWQQRTKWRSRGRRINWGSYFDKANFFNLGR